MLRNETGAGPGQTSRFHSRCDGIPLSGSCRKAVGPGGTVSRIFACIPKVQWTWVCACTYGTTGLPGTVDQMLGMAVAVSANRNTCPAFTERLLAAGGSDFDEAGKASLSASQRGPGSAPPLPSQLCAWRRVPELDAPWSLHLSHRDVTFW